MTLCITILDLLLNLNFTYFLNNSIEQDMVISRCYVNTITNLKIIVNALDYHSMLKNHTTKMPH